MPAATRRSTRRSRWNASSSSTSRSMGGRRKGIRKTRRTSRGGHGARGAQRLADRARVPLPRRGLGAELLTPRAAQLVVLGPAVVLRVAPLTGEPAFLLEAVQGGVQRPFLDEQI